MARPTGEGGVSVISRAAGRNASSSRPRAFGRKRTTFSPGFIDPRLNAMQRGVAAAGFDELVVRSVLGKPAFVDGEDPVGRSHRRKPVRDNQHRSSSGDFAHIRLDDALAFIVESARRFVENENAGIGHKRARDGDPLALASR